VQNAVVSPGNSVFVAKAGSVAVVKESAELGDKQ
jgi:hypothetical protein